MISSGDTFSSPEGAKEYLKIFPNVLAEEMESSAINQIAIKNKIKFSVVRAIANYTLKPLSKKEYKKNEEKVATKAAKITI